MSGRPWQTRGVADELRRIHQQPGRCIACDEPLRQRHSRGRRRSALCGSAECLRVYHQLRRSLERELARELLGARAAIASANDHLLSL